ncbi:MAG: SDR family oxidoreductase [Candidatus Zixiibacteriota bacterium]|nr:MAG: SDR family oxidoreductase [candidate division Zixibacteria bacterium]
MLTGKYALVTGANRGIGLAILKTLAQHGANVIGGARREGSLDDVCSELSDSCGIEATPVYFDVSQPDQVKAAFQKITRITKQLDIAVNNAGIMDSSLLAMARSEDIESVFATNVFGTIYVMQYAARMMIRHKSGSIINLSSIMGVNGAEGQVVYSGSKAAIIGITRSAAKELAPYQIRVNAIAPGFIDTDMVSSISEEIRRERVDSIKIQRIGTPEDVANCTLFLASDNAAYVTGQVVGVDGGMLV